MTLAVATLSLGLGIGATTVMYSLLSRVTHYDVGFANEDRRSSSQTSARVRDRLRPTRLSRPC